MTPFSLANPWPRVGWGTLAVILGISLVLGFIVLSRYQQNGEPLGAWAAICRGLGITPDVEPASAPQPPLRTPTLVAWTGGTLDQIAAGNAKDGAFIALNCTACHGEGGVSTSDLIPTLAGMDPAVIYKQLADYRSGKRLWGVMNGIAKALWVKDSADVASYFAGRPGGLPALTGLRVPEGGRRCGRAILRSAWYSPGIRHAASRLALPVTVRAVTNSALRRCSSSAPPISKASCWPSLKACARTTSASRCARSRRN